MESTEGPEREQRRRTIEELCSRKVGLLIQIIDNMAGMNLSVREVETVLRTCWMNGDCASRFGASIRAEKEKDLSGFDRPIHPQKYEVHLP